MEENNRQHFDNTWMEIWGQLSHGLKDISRGTIELAKGGFKILEGSFRIIDTTALGIGAIAILGVGGVGIAPLWAMVSKGKNIVNTEQEIARLSTDPRIARAFGYPLLIIAGGYSDFILREK